MVDQSDHAFEFTGGKFKTIFFSLNSIAGKQIIFQVCFKIRIRLEFRIHWELFKNTALLLPKNKKMDTFVLVKNDATELFLKKCRCYNCRYIAELGYGCKVYICPKCENLICENCLLCQVMAVAAWRYWNCFKFVTQRNPKKN